MEVNLASNCAHNLSITDSIDAMMAYRNIFLFSFARLFVIFWLYNCLQTIPHTYQYYGVTGCNPLAVFQLSPRLITSPSEYFTTSIALAHSDLQRRVTISLPQFCQSGMDSEQILSDSCHLLDWVCIVSQVCTRLTEFIPFYPTNTENLLVIHKILTHESRSYVSELTILSVCLTSSSSLVLRI